MALWLAGAIIIAAQAAPASSSTPPAGPGPAAAHAMPAPPPVARAATTPDVQAALDPALESCLAGQKLEDDGQTYVTHCYQDAFDRANAELDKGFAGLTARMTRDRLAAGDVRDAADHWHAYRDAWCRIEKAGEPDAPSRGLTELQCRTEISLRLLYRMRAAWQR